MFSLDEKGCLSPHLGPDILTISSLVLFENIFCPSLVNGSGTEAINTASSAVPNSPGASQAAQMKMLDPNPFPGREGCLCEQTKAQPSSQNRKFSEISQ